MAEDNDDIILRGYECFNKRTTATVTLGVPVKKAFICDMLENNIRELKVTGNTITVDFKPFEIITVKIKR